MIPFAVQMFVVIAFLLIPDAALAQRPLAPVLQNFNAAISDLAATVRPSVVQVLVSGYKPVPDGAGGSAVGRFQGAGSGVVLHADGYIVTNAHVIDGADRVRVALPAPLPAGGTPLAALGAAQGRTIPATVVGIARDADLALLKVDHPGLVPIPFADYDAVRQGELVFAFGSPEGLRDSVSMGVVSTTARLLSPDSPSVFIQTDAPINPGSSGGALVNVRGELVGINTFILTQSGGHEGLGFAVPSAVVSATFQQLLTHGHPNRGSIGIQVQAVTPALAEGLHLARTTGVLISDVIPHSPADDAGLSLRDIILRLNQRPVDSVPLLRLAVSTLQPRDAIEIEVLRETATLTVRLTVGESANALDMMSDLADPRRNSVPALGIVGADLIERVRAALPALRRPTGVLVVARMQGSSADGLVPGDVIHAFNRHGISSLAALQVLADDLPPHSEVVVQVERGGRLEYVVVSTP